MTILYSSDFESFSDFAVPAGWITQGGTDGWKVRDVGAYACSGTKSMLAVGQDDSYPVTYTGIAARTAVDYTFSQKAKFHGTDLLLQRVRHVESSAGFFGTSAYVVDFVATASGVTANLYRWDGSSMGSIIGTGSRSFSVSADDIVKTRMVVDGVNVSVWVWNSTNEPMPGSPIFTFTDSVQRAAGYLQIALNNGTNTTLAGFDDVVISDVASGLAPHDIVGSNSQQVNTGSQAAIYQEGPTAGILTIGPLKNNTGTLYASVSSWTVEVKSATTGALVVRKTGLTSSALGILTVSDAAITPDVAYAVEAIHATYGRGLPIITAT